MSANGRSVPALLVLEDGFIAAGKSFGAIGESFGEAVFTTGMTGYQETLTDPSYRRQIVVMTAPHIGITGMNDEDDESRRIWVSGFVVRDPARRVSSWRATGSLAERMRAEGIVGLCQVDTRAITRHLRSRGAMRAGVFSGEAAAAAPAELVETVRRGPSMLGADLAGEVSTKAPYVVPAAGTPRFRVAALDLGIKAMTPKLMSERGIEVVVLPASTQPEEVARLNPDGIFLSNGPGDPRTATHAIELVRWALNRRLPLFGICFGNQMLGRALGLDTYKLKFGHRGINQPVRDQVTGRVEITAQNHGFAVKAPIGETAVTPFGRVEVSHVGLNDGVVEGLRCLDVPAFSVQYHPEAAAGPHDSAYLFDRFVELMRVQAASALRSLPSGGADASA